MVRPGLPRSGHDAEPGECLWCEARTFVLEGKVEYLSKLCGQAVEVGFLDVPFELPGFEKIGPSLRRELHRGRDEQVASLIMLKTGPGPWRVSLDAFSVDFFEWSVFLSRTFNVHELLPAKATPSHPHPPNASCR